MSGGMAEVIADVLSKHRKYVRNEDSGGVICDECGWEVASKWPEANAGKSTTDRMTGHESHAVLTALTKAGYGLMPDVQPEFGARVMLLNGLSPEPEGHGPKRNPNWITTSTHFRLVGPWTELAKQEVA